MFTGVGCPAATGTPGMQQTGGGWRAVLPMFRVSAKKSGWCAGTKGVAPPPPDVLPTPGTAGVAGAVGSATGGSDGVGSDTGCEGSVGSGGASPAAAEPASRSTDALNPATRTDRRTLIRVSFG